ncbi:MAG: hypothetical protein U1C73_15100 [Dietzia sp.]|nr:hypothetical protein [Dietzia sp.]
MNNDTITPADGPFEITNEVTVITGASRWTLRPDTYLRQPHQPHTRQRTPSIDDALDDDLWHHHDGIWYLADLNAMRILPSGRPAGAYGIRTGSIASIHGT